MTGYSDVIEVDVTDAVRQLAVLASQIADRTGRIVDGHTTIHFWVEGDGLSYLADGSSLGIEVAIDAIHRELPTAAQALRLILGDQEVVHVAERLVEHVSYSGHDMISSTQLLMAGATPLAPTLPAADAPSTRIEAYRSAIIGLASGAAAPLTVLEEIHSTIETLLRTLVSEPAHSFPTLVVQASEAGLIDSADVDCITAMNDLRKQAKHHCELVTAEQVIGHYLATQAAVVTMATRLA